MGRRTDIHSILLIGSGPIVIGQACEFDYSGTQACRALREEGYRVILANSNPATIMTDPDFADATYIEPLTLDVLASIIEHRVSQALEPAGGTCTIKQFDRPLDLEDYVEVCLGRNVPRSWAFALRLEIPGLPRLEKLAWIGHRSARMVQVLNQEGGPSLFWSRRNPEGFPKWVGDGAASPYAAEITSRAGNGDEWYARLGNDSIERVQTTELAGRIAEALVERAGLGV